MNRTSGKNYFDWNRPITRDGQFKGVTPGGSTVADGVENLLYPAEGPAVSLVADNATREFGSSTGVLLHYTVVKRTNPLTSIKLDGKALDVMALADNYMTSCTAGIDTSYTLVAATASESGAATTTVRWRNKRFAFTSSQDLLSLSEADLNGVVNAQVGEFADARQRSDKFTLASNYIYYVYPVAFGNAAFIAGGLPNSAYQKRSFSYINSFGYAAAYVLYRSGSKASGQLAVDLL